MKRLLLLAAISLAACETTFEVDVREPDPLIVVNGDLHPDSLFRVDLSYSYGVDESPPSEWSDASAVAYAGGLPVGELAWSGGTRYYVPGLRVRAGEVYTLRVSSAELGSAEATVQVPHAPVADVRIQQLGPVDEQTHAPYEITVRLTDPDSLSNFYALSMHSVAYEDGVRRGFSQHMFKSGDPALQDGDPSSALLDGGEAAYETAYFSDDVFDGTTYDIRIREELGLPRVSEAGDRADSTIYHFRLRALSEPYYRYLKALARTDVEGPFAEPFELPTNVEGGLGVLAGFSEKQLLVLKLVESD